ncbi:MAG: AgmX/PglI C-terminal domain-containing protein, partial [Bdellovibrio sp.]|nr:AgmX/PglI C-terminal domain-containing protein [Bdellovibrio sp.]
AATPVAVGTGLTSEFIQDTLRAQRNSFFKCYTQLLQRTPGVVGQASVGFTIERSGKVSQADITSSSIADPAFKKCLIEAIRRVEFKSFGGDPSLSKILFKFAKKCIIPGQ